MRKMYPEIVADLRARIANGEFAPGDRLPSTRALADQWGVVRNTAGRAVDELARLGLVEIHHGKGAFVTDRGAIANIDPVALRNRVEAVMRWLIGDGHMTPMAKRMILTILDDEGVTGDVDPDTQLAELHEHEEMRDPIGPAHPFSPHGQDATDQ